MRIAFLVDGSGPGDVAPDVRADADLLAQRGHAVEIVALPPSTQPNRAHPSPPDVFATADVVAVTSRACAAMVPSTSHAAVVRWGETVPAALLPRSTLIVTRMPGATATTRAADQAVRFGLDPRFVAAATETVPVHGGALRIGTTADAVDTVRTAVEHLDATALVALDPTDAPARRARLLRTLDLFVLAADSPTSTATLLEVLATGTPCIVVTDDDFPTRVTGRHDATLAVEPDDASQLAEAITLVMRHPELRASLQRAGRECARHHGPHGRAEDLERALALALARRDTHALPTTPMTTTIRGPERDLARELEQRAELHCRDGAIHEAIACLDAALALDPRAVLPMIRIGELHLTAGEPERALQSLDRAIDAGATSYRVHDARARALRATCHSTSAATHALEAAVRCEDVDAATFRVLAETLRASGDVEGARVATREAVVRAAIG